MLDFNRSNHIANTSMGAVRVPVKLTNAIDEALVNRGLLNPTQLRVCETEALVDVAQSELSYRCILCSNLVYEFGVSRSPGMEMAERKQ